MGIGGGSKFTLEKTWRASGVGTTNFNAPGNFTIPYGRNVINVSGAGGTGTAAVPGNLNYNPIVPGNLNLQSDCSWQSKLQSYRCW